MSSQRSAQRNLTRWDQKTHEDIMLAMFEHFRPTAADMKEIVELLHVQKGHTFTDGALLYVETKPRGSPPCAFVYFPMEYKDPSSLPPFSLLALSLFHISINTIAAVVRTHYQHNHQPPELRFVLPFRKESSCSQPQDGGRGPRSTLLRGQGFQAHQLGPRCPSDAAPSRHD